MRTIAVVNQKGGVAKTTTAHAIGSGLNKRGYKVLFIDLDAQCNLSTYCKANTSKGIYNVLTAGEKPNIQHTPNGDIIAGSPHLTIAEKQLTQTGAEYIIKEMLEAIKHTYDFCVIDTPPALSILTINALTGSDSVVIPAQADIFSLQGLLQLKDTLTAVKKYTNSGLKINGIVLTRYNGRAVLSQQIAEDLQKTAGELDTTAFDTKIRECTALKEAQATCQSIFDYAPKSNASKDYDALISEIIERI